MNDDPSNDDTQQTTEGLSGVLEEEERVRLILEKALGGLGLRCEIQAVEADPKRLMFTVTFKDPVPLSSRPAQTLSGVIHHHSPPKGR